MRTRPFDTRSLVPLLVEPDGDPSVDALVAWLTADREATEALLTRHGALLFRGFAVDAPDAFERVCRAVDPDLQNDYLGTSPRDALTPYVFTASELPGHYPIPQHAEMTFLPEPPRRLFFCALRPNVGPGGETPLADFRAVYRDLAPDVRARWEARGIRIVRNYGGPEGQGRRDPRQLKRWDQMFGTTDREQIERICAAHAFTPKWRDDGRLQLVSAQPAARPHPTTGEPVWFNHAHVFHASVAPGEYARIATRMGAWPWRGWQLAATVLGMWQRLGADPEDAAMHVTFGDGGAIPEADLEAVRDAIWKNMVFPRWERGDVTAIDNRAVAHGRMPYTGDRLVAVCWA
ncbi:MAG: TauD/TfdA family dioxygenase [Pseudomonadota bacterium]|nr:TauD/TfdA family dioxygenase [Pseudomonadota bacterium]